MRLRILALLLLALAAQACGVRGPLYLPEEAPAGNGTAPDTAQAPEPGEDEDGDPDEGGR